MRRCCSSSSHGPGGARSKLGAVEQPGRWPMDKRRARARPRMERPRGRGTIPEVRDRPSSCSLGAPRRMRSARPSWGRPTPGASVGPRPCGASLTWWTARWTAG
eukprot:12807805-Alexandrium_andersonii.AAC.1